MVGPEELTTGMRPILKSGLRAKFAANRIETAAAIAERVLEKSFPGYGVRKITYARGKFSSGWFVKDKEKATTGGFEILSALGSYVARVDMDRKPAIHVLKGNEILGKALAKAFKEHADYWFSPKVKKFDKLSPLTIYYNSDSRKQQKFAEEQKRIKQ